MNTHVHVYKLNLTDLGRTKVKVGAEEGVRHCEYESILLSNVFIQLFYLLHLLLDFTQSAVNVFCLFFLLGLPRKLSSILSAATA